MKVPKKRIEKTSPKPSKKATEKNSGKPTAQTPPTSPTTPTSHDTAGLMDLFERTPHPMSIDEVLRYTQTPRREKRALRALIDQLEEKQVLMRVGQGTRVAWTPTSQSKSLQGTIDIQRAGFAFVTPSDAGKTTRDIFIPENAINTAWQGDLVEIRITRQAKGENARAEGQVARIVERKTQALTVQATSKKSPHGRLFRPTDSRYKFDLIVDVSSLEDPVKEHDILRVVELKLLEKASNIWQAQAAQILGHEHDVATQERLVKWNHNIPMEFSETVLAEAKEINENANTDTLLINPDCTDLTKLPFVTIDGEDARDFDDAILVQQDGTGWELWVAIADVSRYVHYNSAIDTEAQQRANSAYFPASVEPMLPEALSNNLCSLMPNEIRATLVAHLHINAEGTCTQSAFMPAAIRSQARLTYTQVEHALNDTLDLMPPDEGATITPHVSMLKQAMSLAKILQEQRKSRGSLELDLPEPRVIIDENDRIQDIIPKDRLEAHKLIEACMLAANEAVALFLTSKHLTFPYRIHPEPDPERLTNLFTRLKNTRLAQDLPQEATAKSIPALLEQTKANHDARTTALLHQMILRAMMQAQYSPELEPHFGLASSCYCHFTSPIRRYADLLVHRALRHTLGFSTGPILTGQKLLELCDTCNKQERIAIAAERETLRRLGCVFLQGREGEIFDGVISGVTSFGFFVELGHMGIEGLVGVENLHDDYYTHDAERQALIGANGRTFSLGDTIRVSLMDVNIDRVRINLEVEDLMHLSEKQRQKHKVRSSGGGGGMAPPKKRQMQGQEHQRKGQKGQQGRDNQKRQGRRKG